MDALLVAPIVEHSHAMFGNVLGAWIPFALIFGSSYLAGSLVRLAPKPIPGRLSWPQSSHATW